MFRLLTDSLPIQNELNLCLDQMQGFPTGTLRLWDLDSPLDWIPELELVPGHSATVKVLCDVIRGIYRDLYKLSSGGRSPSDEDPDGRTDEQSGEDSGDSTSGDSDPPPPPASAPFPTHHHSLPPPSPDPSSPLLPPPTSRRSARSRPSTVVEVSIPPRPLAHASPVPQVRAPTGTGDEWVIADPRVRHRTPS